MGHGVVGTPTLARRKGKGSNIAFTSAISQAKTSHLSYTADQYHTWSLSSSVRQLLPRAHKIGVTVL